ncbi:hypothetical protein ACFYZ3_00135 [Streptomyces sp. NPDC001599]|uniref:hypothetical protein n=1 Tax=Streptomyces sp. NPDC001599 TaxID=3364591 RepID=UPI0036AD4205
MTQCISGEHDFPFEDETGAYCSEHGVTLRWNPPAFAWDDLLSEPGRLHSSAFPWLRELTDEEAYEFLDQVIRAAQDAGTHTAFLHALDVLVDQHSPAPALPHGVMPERLPQTS